MKLLILLFLSLNCFSQKNVYGVKRFNLIKDSVTFSGTVIRSTTEKDGDYHFVIKTDSAQIVCECICQKKSKIKKVREACKGYHKKFNKPKPGQHLTVTGYYVFDKNHNWYELHPVYKIQ